MKHVLGFNSLLEIKKGWCIESSDSSCCKSVLVPTDEDVRKVLHFGPADNHIVSKGR